jgi:hypothetical protein
MIELLIFVGGVCGGFWLLKYAATPVAADIERWAAVMPRPLGKLVGMFAYVVLFSVPILVGAGLLALAGFSVWDIFGK